MLQLDDQVISGYGLKITAELALPSEDLSGTGSSSLTAENGTKPKRLRCTLNVKYDTPEQLQAINLLAEGKQSSGQRKVYTIINQTAEAFNIRQVRFTERLTAQELDDVEAWAVSFVLLEYQSVAERVEAKTAPSTAETNSEIPELDAIDESGQVAETEEMGWFERNIVKPMDSALAEEDTRDGTELV